MRGLFSWRCPNSTRVRQQTLLGAFVGRRELVTALIREREQPRSWSTRLWFLMPTVLPLHLQCEQTITFMAHSTIIPGQTAVPSSAKACQQTHNRTCHIFYLSMSQRRAMRALALFRLHVDGGDAGAARAQSLDSVCECLIRWPYIIDGPFISAILRSALPQQEYSTVSSIKKPKISI